MQTSMNIVVVGATRGMGRAVAREYASRGAQLCLLGRDMAELQRSAQDLQARSPAPIQVHFGECDLSKPEGFASALKSAESALGRIDGVVVTAGMFASQEELEESPELLEKVLAVNFTNTVVFCEHARKTLLKSGGGFLCVFSSVAGERGRKPVILYGASKAGLSAYLEGLDHKFHSRGLRVTCVKPGFVKTGMTEGLKPPPFAGTPEQVAKEVVRAIDSGKAVVYTPKMWALVMMVIRMLPRFVMRKIGF